MTPLRQRMIEDLRIRGLSQNTIDSYVGAVERFARFFGRSPAELDREHIRTFQVHLVCDRHISTGTLNSYTSALRFLYTVTLGYGKENKRLMGSIAPAPHALCSSLSLWIVTPKPPAAPAPTSR